MTKQWVNFPLYNDFFTLPVDYGYEAFHYSQFVFQLVADGRRVIDPVSNKLTVFNTTISQDSGLYTCFAQSSAGTAEYAVLVTIQDIMSWVTLI